MKKFFVLLQKEIKELLTLRALMPIIIMVTIFLGIGQVIGSEKTKFERPWTLAVIDQSDTPLSKELLDTLKQQNIEVRIFPETNIDQAISSAQQQGIIALLVIPENFAESFENHQKPQLSLYTFMRGFSVSSMIGLSRLQGVTESANEFLSNKRLQKEGSNLTPDLLKNPVTYNNFTVLNNREANVDPAQVSGYLQSQTTFVPVILFLVIVLAAQMVAGAIAGEKENKTLEILLSSPVDRKAIIFAKILAAALVALLFSSMYIIGWRWYMASLTGGTDVLENVQFRQALEALGVVVNPLGYFLLGISLFFSILCALAIAIILGIMAEDVKSSQTIVTPLMILIMIPYFLTLFLDIPSASPLTVGILYAIPFSHTFLAIHNVMLQNYWPILYGILYQALVALLFIFWASKIFTTDKALTLKFRLKRK